MPARCHNIANRYERGYGARFLFAFYLAVRIKRGRQTADIAPGEVHLTT